jgi:hypothetical protein
MSNSFLISNHVWLVICFIDIVDQVDKDVDLRMDTQKTLQPFHAQLLT